MNGSIVVLELNELSPPLLEQFMRDGQLPSFERLRARSRCFVTEAGEAQDHLNPWIQWVTAHTGVAYAEHGVFKLGEGALLQHPTLADVVGDAGGEVWLCGPMNVVPTRPVRGWWLPDPWNPRDEPVPTVLDAFAGFVRANVQEHTNVARRLSARAHARFVWFMVRHGLSTRTVAAVVAQLVGERVGRRERWRRAALLDRFQWDLFRHHWRRARPQLATYFSNTTAHYQHVYWRHMDPAPFTIQPDPVERARFADAVPYGYREMDRLVGEALTMVDDGTTLVFCTALSQQPYLLKEAEGGSRFHRPYDLNAVLHELDVRGVTQVAPVMSAQHHVYFASESETRAAEELLRGARVDGRLAFDLRRVGADLFMGCSITDDVPEGAELVVGAVRLDFHERYYRAETAKSGYHHPDGALWISGPGVQPGVVADRVPLAAVAPTLLNVLGASVPTSMSTPPLALRSVAADGR